MSSATVARAAATLVLVACVRVAVTAGTPVAAATRIDVAARPLLDGKLDDACWQTGSWQGDMKVLGATTPASQQTRFCILFDQDNLYIGVECAEPEMDKLKEVRGGGIYRGECIELFLDTNRDGQTYTHPMTNTLGICEGKRDGRELVWRARAHKGKGRWTSEMAVPFSSLVIGADVGSTWRFNLCRQRYAGKRELSTWAPLSPQGGFHQPTLFGELRGLDVDFARFRYRVGKPVVRREIRGRALDVGFELAVANHTGKASKLRLEGTLIPPQGKPQSHAAKLDLAHAESKPVCLSGYTVTGSGDYILLVALTDPTAGRVFYRTRFPVRLEYTPLGIRVVQPCYRATIFATQKLDDIQLLVDVGLDEAGRRASSLLVALAAAGSAKPPQTRRIAPVPSAEVDVRFDARTLAVGDYVITASLSDRNGKAIATSRHELHKLPPAPGSEVRLDEHGNTVVDGVPTFIYGYFSIGPYTYRGRDWRGMAETHADGCTALLEYNAPYWKPDTGKRFLDTARANGLGVAIYPYYRTFHRDGGLPKIGAPDTSLSERIKQGITERVSWWKGHPAMLAWYLADEPDCNNSSPESLEEVYRLVRRLDPYHPCIVLCKGVSTHHAVRRCADIFMPDPYIHPRLDGQFDTPLTVFRDYFEAIGRTGKAKWVTPQAFASGLKNGSTQCEPSFHHLRAMAYMSVVHGAKGVLYYAWGYLTRFPASYHGARFLSREIAALAPVLLGPDAKATVKVEPEGSEIDVLLKVHGGDLTVFAVNTQFREADATFDVPGLNGRTLSVVSEARKVEANGSRFADHFGKYGVHVYTTAVRPPDAGKTLKQVEAEVAAIHNARFKPGNVCLRQTTDGKLSGVTIEWTQGVVSIDGYTQPFTSHKWNRVAKPPADLTVSFPRKQAVARIVVYSPNLKDYDVQAWDGAAWATLATVNGNAEQVVTSRFAPVTTDKLRLHIRAIQPPEWQTQRHGYAVHGAVVDEIEAFGP